MLGSARRGGNLGERAAELVHEVGDDPVEGEALVEARLGEVLEVTHGDRQLVLELLGLGLWAWVGVAVGWGGVEANGGCAWGQAEAVGPRTLRASARAGGWVGGPLAGSVGRRVGGRVGGRAGVITKPTKARGSAGRVRWACGSSISKVRWTSSGGRKRGIPCSKALTSGAGRGARDAQARAVTCRAGAGAGAGARVGCGCASPRR